MAIVIGIAMFDLLAIIVTTAAVASVVDIATITLALVIVAIIIIVIVVSIIIIVTILIIVTVLKPANVKAWPGTPDRAAGRAPRGGCGWRWQLLGSKLPLKKFRYG